MSFIKCIDISKTYTKGNTPVTPLQALDVSVEQGSFLSLMGPSGSGKTTLLNILAGIDSATTGTVRIGEHDITAMKRGALTKWRAEHVGYIFQLYHLIPVLTAFENIELPLLLTAMNKKTRRQRVLETLDIVGLSDRADHFPRQLSGGQEQRVAIARAIVANPPLLVADEPTGDLDHEAADAILVLLRSLVTDFNKTIVMVTHDPHAAEIADRVMHLDKGRLVEAAS